MKIQELTNKNKAVVSEMAKEFQKLSIAIL